MKKGLLLLFLLFSGVGIAQNLNEIVLKDAGSGTQYNMSSLTSEKAAVLIFFGNRCAYNKYYINRIRTLSKEFTSSQVSFILVNSNSIELMEEESETEMKKFLERNGLNLPYLMDSDKQLKNLLGASRSPEAFVLKFKGGIAEKVYSGAIDDSPQSEGDVSHPYLRMAIVSLLANNKPEVNHVRPAGCLIR